MRKRTIFHFGIWINAFWSNFWNPWPGDTRCFVSFIEIEMLFSLIRPRWPKVHDTLRFSAVQFYQVPETTTQSGPAEKQEQERRPTLRHCCAAPSLSLLTLSEVLSEKECDMFSSWNSGKQDRLQLKICQSQVSASREQLFMLFQLLF